jgi:hypothetical protein
LQLVQGEFDGGIAAKQICTGAAQVVDQVHDSDRESHRQTKFTTLICLSVRVTHHLLFCGCDGKRVWAQLSVQTNPVL